MTKLTLTNSPARAALIAALALGGTMALAGCEQHPYPTPAPEDSAPPPPSQLMGAPDNQPQGPGLDSPTPEGQPAMGPATPGGPPSGAPGYAGPPVGPNGAPPPGYAGPGPYSPPVPARPPCPPDASQHGPNAPTVIICSTPVPNPVEDEAYPHIHRHHYRGYFAPAHGAEQGYAHHSYAPPPVSRLAYPHHLRHGYGRAPVSHGYASGYLVHNGHRYRIVGPAGPHANHRLTPPHAQAPHAAAPAHPGPVTPQPTTRSLHPHLVKPVEPAITPKPVPQIQPRPPHHHPHGGAAKTAAASTTNTTSAATGVSGTPTERYAALRSALATIIAREATLNAPSHVEPGQAADVSLTVPSDFAQTVRQEAAKEDLSDQAASVNLTSTLSGAGYTITPAEAQSQPLTLGQATVFHWKVTAPPTAQGNTTSDAKAALQASLNADFLSDGQSLPLGPVKPANGEHWTGRVVGVGLLVLIALILLGWAAQRKRPAVAGAAKPRDNHTNGD